VGNVGKGLGPKSQEEQEVYAVERFRVDVQSSLYAAMKAAGVSQSELAHRMQVSPAYITQLFDTGRNLTVRTVAKVCYALGREPRLNLLVEGASPKRWTQRTERRHGIVNQEARLPVGPPAHDYAGQAWSQEIVNDNAYQREARLAW
jgi:transcriptional regulator with XRE-family HTH domain